MGKGWKYEPKDEGYEWLAERIDLPPYAAPSVAKVRIDSWLSSPNYSLAYAAAWHALLPRTKELAIPILFLQRHSLELVAKDILKLLLSIRREMKLAHGIFGEAATDDIIDDVSWNAAWERAHEGHRLGPLFAKISSNLLMLDLPPLPEEFHEARRLFEKLDKDDVSRWRYRTVRGNPKTEQVESFEGSFTKPIVADLDESTRLVYRIVAEHARFDDDDDESSFLQALADAGRLVNFDLSELVKGLERATLSGDVVWSAADATSLKTTVLNQERWRLLPTCVVATRGTRRFVIIKIRSTRIDDGSEGESLNDVYLLGSQSTDGTLSEVLSPRDYGSNLVSAAIESMQARGALV